MIEELKEIYDWLEAYVDYYLCEEPVDDDMEETDAQRLNRQLPALKQAIDQLKNPPKPKVKKERKPKTEKPEVCMTEQELKNLIYTKVKEARESINPNYRYCILDTDVDECYLTDDIGVAMEAAATKSRSGKIWRVCRIVKSCNDGSYRTIIEGRCCGGHYYEDNQEFLHFDYIAQRAEVKKL